MCFPPLFFQRLRDYLSPNGKLYIVGMEPIPDFAQEPASIITEIRRARDACILLGGHRPYRCFCYTISYHIPYHIPYIISYHSSYNLLSFLVISYIISYHTIHIPYIISYHSSYTIYNIIYHLISYYLNRVNLFNQFNLFLTYSFLKETTTKRYYI